MLTHELLNKLKSVNKVSLVCPTWDPTWCQDSEQDNAFFLNSSSDSVGSYHMSTIIITGRTIQNLYSQK